VTGLSRAGKSVFIVSLIQNLLALAEQRDVLPQLTRRLSDQGTNRLLDVTILSPGISAVPHFDLAAKLARLAADEPAWPERTDDVAEVSLALTVHRSPLVPIRGSLMGLLSDRFEAYKHDMRTNVFDAHFHAFDRQLVLVDVLSALYGGKDAFQDAARAIKDIAAAIALRRPSRGPRTRRRGYLARRHRDTPGMPGESWPRGGGSGRWQSHRARGIRRHQGR
jgi:predicted YcjX-like family ATPase